MSETPFKLEDYENLSPQQKGYYNCKEARNKDNPVHHLYGKNPYPYYSRDWQAFARGWKLAETTLNIYDNVALQA